MYVHAVVCMHECACEITGEQRATQGHCIITRFLRGRESRHTRRFRGAPSLLMHDQAIMHFCAFTHRWQDNRITEKRIWGRQDLPRLWEQPDSFFLHHKRWRKSGSALSHLPGTYTQRKYYLCLYLSLSPALLRTLFPTHM